MWVLNNRLMLQAVQISLLIYAVSRMKSKDVRTQTKSKINDLVEAQAEIGCNSFEIESERL